MAPGAGENCRSGVLNVEEVVGGWLGEAYIRTRRKRGQYASQMLRTPGIRSPGSRYAMTDVRDCNGGLRKLKLQMVGQTMTAIASNWNLELGHRGDPEQYP